MSLEWVDANRDSVTVIEYLLTINTSSDRESGYKFKFVAIEELDEAVRELYGIIQP
jgi:hypothetical protein